MIFEQMMPIWEKAAKLIHKMCITRVTSRMAIEYSDMHFCIALCNVNRLDLALPGILLTVPTFNSCSKCLGNPGIIHDRTPDCHRVSWS